ncbi:MAG: hypothetical protein OEY37_11745, partial [Gammaproteobacteria bacterium]|nr:hypothetical protein [Gammaproteobacteria bacterium]
MKGITKANIIAVVAALCLAPLAADANNNNAGGGNKPSKIDVIMVYKAEPDKAEDDRVKGLGGEMKREFENFNMRVISIPETALRHLGNGKGVQFVAKDAPIESFSAAAQQTAGLPSAGSRNAFPVDSTIGIAVLDSGVAEHNDLSVATRMNCTIAAAATSGTYADFFNTASYSNNDGSDAWSGAWVEENDDGLATSQNGDALVHGTSFYMDNYWGGALPALRRTANLEGASSATLSFDYRGYGAGGVDTVAIEVSSNGGASYKTLELIELVGNVDGKRSYALGDYVELTSQVTIRLRVAQGLGGANQYVRFDNVR